MGKVESIEDLEIWQRSRRLVQEIYELSKHDDFRRDFILRDQICRSALSIMSNVAEGFERGGTREFIQFLSLAKGSAGELRSQLFVVFDQGYCTKEKFATLKTGTMEIARMISALITYLRNSKMKGPKFK